MAIAGYLAHRCDGGENHDASGHVTLAGDPANAASRLQQVATDLNLPGHARTFTHALQALVVGSRDCALTDAPDLHYEIAAEILFLIETLEKRHTPHPAQAS